MVEIDYTRDEYLTPAAIATLKDRYLVEGETSPQDCFARASKAFASNEAHAQRMYDYVSNRWLMYSTPILSNGGTKRGQPIACFGGYVDDSRTGITDHYTENAWLSSMGGGIGGYWGHIRSNGEKTSSGSSSSGIIPFIKVVDSMVLAFSQGGCYTPDAELLTSTGFKKFTDLSYDDKVAQVDDTKYITFVTPLDIIEEDFEGDLYELKGRSTYLRVTSNHSMVLERTVTKNGKKSFDGNLIKVRAELAKYHRDVRHHVSGYGTGQLTALSPLDRLRLAYQADGREGYTTKDGLTTIEFRFTKQRKIDRLKSILQELKVPFNITIHSDGVTRISVQINFKLSKRLNDEFNLEDMSSSYANAWIQELAEWDGSRKATYIKWSSIVESNAKFVQAVAAMAGKATQLTVRKSYGNRVDLYNVGIREFSYVSGDSLEMANVGYYKGKVHCCLVPTGRLIVRQQGQVSICGNTRRGSYAAYLDISHPEVLEFLSIRKPTGGDSNRKSLNLHNAVIISDEFMRKVTGEDSDPSFNLIDPHTGNVTSTVNARELWEQILTLRVETGEPYIMFGDTVNDLRPVELKQLGLKINQSNLCSEITLPTDKDRTFVCCLSSLNLELFDEWKDTSIIDDLTEFLDNVLTYFIDTAPDSMSKAKRGAELGRDIGIGTLGWHSYLQSKMIPFDSVTALSHLNMIHKHIATCAYRTSYRLGKERGYAQDTVQGDSPRRNTHLIAIAPNASSGIICGTSPSVEPWNSNIFTQKTLSGSFEIRNPHLIKLLEGAGLNTEEMWKTIRDNGGSISHIKELFEGEREVFKTAAEINQNWIIEQAALRQKYIDQSQSINLFFNPIDGKISAKYLHDVHVNAWKKGLKTLYYLRSKAIRKADNIGAKVERQVIDTSECVSCEG